MEDLEPSARIWLSRGFSGQFGDPYIKDTEMEGGSVAPSLEVLAGVLDLVVTKPERLTLVDDLAALRTLAARMREAATYDHETNSANGIALPRFLRALKGRVEALAVGDYFLFPGGWMDEMSGHAIMHVVERTGPDSFAFVVCNTGEGVNNHPGTQDVSADVGAKRKFRTAVVLEPIPFERIADEAFWFMLLSLRNDRKAENTPEVAYRALFPFLTNLSFAGSVLATPAARHGPFASPQRAGTCYYRCVLAAMKYVLHARGFRTEPLKQVTLAVRETYVDVVLAQLRHIQAAAERLSATSSATTAAAAAAIAAGGAGGGAGGAAATTVATTSATGMVDLSAGAVTDDERMRIELACRQLARAARKESQRGTLGSDGLRRVLETIQAVDALLTKSAVKVVGTSVELPPPLRLQSVAARLTPFSGFELVRARTDERFDTEVFAGGLSEQVPDLFVDLSELDDVPTDLEGRPVAEWSEASDQAVRALRRELESAAATATASATASSVSASAAPLSAFRRDFASTRALLKRTAERCDALRQKCTVSEPVIALQQIAALIEDVFFTLLPVPAPWSAERAAAVANARFPPRGAPAAEIEAARWVLEDAWTPLVLTRLEQRRTLQSIVELFYHYISARASLPYERAGAGARTLTVAALVAAFDTVLRLRARDGVLPLSQILHGAVRGDPASQEDETALLARLEGVAEADAIHDPSLRAYPRTAPRFVVLAQGLRGNSLKEATEHLLFPSPQAAAARQPLVHYFETMRDRGTEGVLAELQGPPNGFSFKMAAPEMSLTNALIIRTSRENRSPSALMVFADDDLDAEAKQRSRVELVGRWFAHAWDTEDMPEFDWLKTVAFQAVAHFTATPTPAAAGGYYGGDEDNAGLTVYFPGDVPLRTEFRDCIGNPSDPVALIYAFAFRGTYTVSGEPSVVAQLLEPAYLASAVRTLGASATEDEVLQLPVESLPSFSNTLSKQDSEYLLTVLTTPYLRIPLLLRFFADDRLGALFHPHLQRILERALFEPGPLGASLASRGTPNAHGRRDAGAEESKGEGEGEGEEVTASGATGSGTSSSSSSSSSSSLLGSVDHSGTAEDLVSVVPDVRGSDTLGTSHGLLINELQTAPEGTVAPLLALAYQVSDLCTGHYSSSFVTVLLFMIRLVTNVERSLVFVIDQDLGTAPPVRTEAVHQLTRLRLWTLGIARARLLRYLEQANGERDRLPEDDAAAEGGGSADGLGDEDDGDVDPFDVLEGEEEEEVHHGYGGRRGRGGGRGGGGGGGGGGRRGRGGAAGGGGGGGGRRAAKKTKKAVKTREQRIEEHNVRITRVSAEFHAHHALLFGSLRLSELTLSFATALLASASFAIAWYHDESDVPRSLVESPDAEEGGGGWDYQAYMRRRQMAQTKRRLASKWDGFQLRIPAAELFGCLQRQRRHVLKRLQRASPSEIDDVLERVLGTSLRRDRLRSRGWESARREAYKCRLVRESDHPYRAASDTFEEIQFPGATMVTVYFDPRSKTERERDYVSIFTDLSCTATWGPSRIHGGSEGAWPGAGGYPPLVIPGDRCVLHFHSNNEQEDWGYRVTFEATINAELAEALAREPMIDTTSVSASAVASVSTAASASASGATEEAASAGDEAPLWPLRWCQLAVAWSNNDGEAARLILRERQAEILAQIALEDEEERRRNAASAEGARVPGLFRDATGTFEVNVHTGEVFVQGRTRLPTPTSIQGHADFRTVFGNSRPLCSILSHRVHQMRYALDVREFQYTVDSWTSVGAPAPIAKKPIGGGSEEEGAAAVGAAGAAGATGAVLVASDPEPSDDGVASDDAGFVLADSVSPVPSPTGAAGGRTADAGVSAGTEGGESKDDDDEDDSNVTDGATHFLVPRRVNGVMTFAGRAFVGHFDAASLGALGPVVDETLSFLKNSGLLLDSGDSSGAQEGEGGSSSASSSDGDDGQRIWVEDGLEELLETYVWPSERDAEDLLSSSSSSSSVAMVEDAVVGRLLMWVAPGGDLVDRLGKAGTFFELQILRNRPVIQVFRLIELARIAQRELVASSDVRFALRALEVPPSKREGRWNRVLRFIGGFVTGQDVMAGAGGGRAGEMRRRARRYAAPTPTVSVGSMRIRRRFVAAGDPGIYHRREETFVPPRILRGLLPDALLESYEFWQSLETVPHPTEGQRTVTHLYGYPSMRMSASADPATMNTIVEVELVTPRKTLAAPSPNGASQGASASAGAGGGAAAATAAAHLPVFAVVRRYTREAMLRRRHPARFAGEPALPAGSVQVLLNPQLSAAGSLLDRIAKVFTRIESLSHVLLWSNAGSARVADELALDLVELPRLRTGFVPRVGEDGTLRLWSQDYEDLFVSDDRPPELNAHVDGIPHSIILENRTGELFLFVPNLPVARPYVVEEPFTTELVVSHGNHWADVVPTRFFLFAVHASGEFLSAPTVASAMYLSVLFLLTRRYERFCKILTACATDQPLSEEEAWVLAFAAGSYGDKEGRGQDTHPDAIACRLRLALLLSECGAEPLANVRALALRGDAASRCAFIEEQFGALRTGFSKDAEAYEAKVSHVSAFARLTPNEEIEFNNVVMPTSRAPLARAQLGLLRQQQSAKATRIQRELAHATLHHGTVVTEGMSTPSATRADGDAAEGASSLASSSASSASSAASASPTAVDAFPILPLALQRSISTSSSIVHVEVVESAHPLRSASAPDAGGDGATAITAPSSRVVDVPGALSLALTFDPRTDLGAGGWLVLRDPVHVDRRFGRFRFVGAAESSWPGCGGSPLVVLGSRVVVEFQAGSSSVTEPWGWALTVEAEVSMDATTAAVTSSSTPTAASTSMEGAAGSGASRSGSSRRREEEGEQQQETDPSLHLGGMMLREVPLSPDYPEVGPKLVSQLSDTFTAAIGSDSFVIDSHARYVRPRASRRIRGRWGSLLSSLWRDDLNGSKGKLAWPFLFDLVRGDVGFDLLDDAIPRSSDAETASAPETASVGAAAGGGGGGDSAPLSVEDESARSVEALKAVKARAKAKKERAEKKKAEREGKPGAKAKKTTKKTKKTKKTKTSTGDEGEVEDATEENEEEEGEEEEEEEDAVDPLAEDDHNLARNPRFRASLSKAQPTLVRLLLSAMEVTGRANPTIFPVLFAAAATAEIDRVRAERLRRCHTAAALPDALSVETDPTSFPSFPYAALRELLSAAEGCNLAGADSFRAWCGRLVEPGFAVSTHDFLRVPTAAWVGSRPALTDGAVAVAAAAATVDGAGAVRYEVREAVPLILRASEIPHCRPMVNDYSASRHMLHPRRRMTRDEVDAMPATTSLERRRRAMAAASVRFGLAISEEDVVALATFPLAGLGLGVGAEDPATIVASTGRPLESAERGASESASGSAGAGDVFLVRRPAAGNPEHPDGALPDDLPFDLSSVPAARTGVGAAMLERMRLDIRRSAASERSAMQWRLAFLETPQLATLRASLLQPARERSGGSSGWVGRTDGCGFEGPGAAETVEHVLGQLQALRTALCAHRDAERARVRDGIASLTAGANKVPLEGYVASEQERRLRFIADQRRGERVELWFEYLTSALLSTTPRDDLLAFNTYLNDYEVEAALEATAILLLRTSRLMQLRRALRALDEVATIVRNLVESRLHARLVADTRPGDVPPSLAVVRGALQRERYHPLRAWTRLQRYVAALARVADVARSALAARGHDEATVTQQGPRIAALALHLTDFMEDENEARATDLFRADLASAAAAATTTTAHTLAAGECALPPAPPALLRQRTSFTADSDIRSTEDVAQVLRLADGRHGFFRGRRLPAIPEVVREAHTAADAQAALAAAVAPLPALLHVLQFASDGLAGELSARRFFMRREHEDVHASSSTGSSSSSALSASFAYDPRFLVFEFVTTFVLRSRQVQLVNDFLASVREGRPRVHQMLMGGGKSTVVAPLLALILADGHSLVTQVVPSKLLDMSRGFMRNAFSSVIAKRVLTFKFDRSAEDIFGSVVAGGVSPADAAAAAVKSLHRLRSKFQRARVERSVVITTPESIKSFVLKYVDTLQQIEATPEDYFLPASQLPASKVDRIAREAARLHAEEEVADAMRDVLRLWGKEERGVLLMDEVDLLLHPLKSELNFPIGQKKPLDLSPQRWEFPLYLLDAFFFTSLGRLSVPGQTLDARAERILRQLHDGLQVGLARFAVQASPHPVLLRESFYHEFLRPALAEWSLRWLRRRPEVRDDLRRRAGVDAHGAGESKEESEREGRGQGREGEGESAGVGGAKTASTERDDDADALREEAIEDAEAASEAGGRGPSGITSPVPPSFVRLVTPEVRSAVVAYVQGASTTHSEAAHLVEDVFSPASLRLLNLVRDWLVTFTPHCLSKINRVSFGLLTPSDLARYSADDIRKMPRSRRLLAVPFEGKDAPSRASEFAHPEVLIGLTILAYRYEGMRRSDVADVVRQMKHKLGRETGPLTDRPARVEFSHWLEKADADAKRRARELEARREADRTAKKEGDKESEKEREKEADEEEEEEADDEAVEGGAEEGKEDDAGEGKNAEKPASSSSSSSSLMLRLPSESVLPLELFQPTEQMQMHRCFVALRRSADVIYHYLTKHVFPAVMHHQETKLMASGLDLGSDLLFDRRLGFSGTPSDLLPQDLRPCHFEPGTDANIVRTLTSDALVSHVTLDGRWDVNRLLSFVATADPPFHALIDTGALVTGMTNLEVARFLLASDMRPSIRGVVFLDDEDRQMILVRDTGRAVPIKQCGVPPHQRFTFYDQVHTTGMDIKQALDARAAVTLGKDMTLRDYAQGCWRMRGLGRGQTLTAIIVPEVAQLIERVARHARVIPTAGASSQSSMPRDIVAWLAVNGIRSEQMQHLQLCLQQLSYTWRKQALRDLVASRAVDDGVEAVAVAEQNAGFLTRFRDPLEIRALVRRLAGDAAAASAIRLPSEEEPDTTGEETAPVESEEDAIARAIAESMRFEDDDLAAALAASAAEFEASQAASQAAATATDSDSAGAATEGDAGAAAPEASPLPPPPAMHPGADSAAWRRRCVAVFREPLDLSVKGIVPRPRPFVETLREQLAQFEDFFRIASEGQAGGEGGRGAGSLRPELVPVAEEMARLRSVADVVLRDAVRATEGVDDAAHGAEADLDDAGVAVDGHSSGGASAGAAAGPTTSHGNLRGSGVSSSSAASSAAAAAAASSSPSSSSSSSSTTGGDGALPSAPPALARAWSWGGGGEGGEESAAGAEAGEHLQHDKEIVQEQEQEREQEIEIEVRREVEVQFAPTRGNLVRWPVKDLASPTDLLGTVFVPMKDFELRPNEPTYAFPPNLFLSENYAPLLPPPALPRRLRNVTVTLEWFPALDRRDVRSAAEEAEEAERTPRVVTIALDEAATVRRALHTRHSALVHPWLFTSEGRLREGVSLASRALVRLLLPSGLALDACLPFTPTAVTLDRVDAEVEDVAAADAAATAVASTASTVAGPVDHSAPVESIVDPTALARASRARSDRARLAARLFNAEVFFSPAELVTLVRSVRDIPIPQRRYLFDCLVFARRRDRPTWKDSPAAPAFVHDNEASLAFVHSLARRVAGELQRSYGGRLATAFEALDTNGDGLLSRSELLEGLLRLRLSGYTAADLSALVTAADANADGHVDYREFVAQFADLDAVRALTAGDADNTARSALASLAEAEAADAERRRRWDQEDDSHADDLASSVLAEFGASSSSTGDKGQGSGRASSSSSSSSSSPEDSYSEVFVPKSSKATGTIADYLSASDVMRIGEIAPAAGGEAIVRSGNILSTRRPGQVPSVTPRRVLLRRGTWYHEVVVMNPGRTAVGAQAASTLAALQATRERVACIGYGDATYRGDAYHGQGVGDDDRSWGLTASGCLRHAGREVRVLPRALRRGDVVGLCVDADAQRMLFFLNGKPIRASRVELARWLERVRTLYAEERASDREDGRRAAAVAAPGRSSGAEESKEETSAPTATAIDVEAGVVAEDGWAGCLVDGFRARGGGVVPVVSFAAGFEAQLNLGHTPFRYLPPRDTAQSVRRAGERVQELKVAKEAGVFAGRFTPTSEVGSIKFEGNNDILRCVGHFPSAVVAGVLLCRGKWYYEGTVVKAGHCSQLGWADLSFCGAAGQGRGVGDDRASWAFDGERRCLWFDAKSPPFGKYWRAGDTIGFAADLDHNTLAFSINGEWSAPLGVAFTNIDYVVGITPAWTVSSGSAYRVNLGERAFEFAPPSEEYRSVWHWIVERRPELRSRSQRTAEVGDRIAAWDHRGGAASGGGGGAAAAASGGGAGGAGAGSESEAVVPAAPKLIRGISTLHTPSADIRTLTRVPMRIASGDLVARFIDQRVLGATARRPSFVGHMIALTRGKWFFEVLVNQIQDGLAVGWARPMEFFGDWTQDLGVGDDTVSWGWDPHTLMTVHAGERKYWGRAAPAAPVVPAPDADATATATATATGAGGAGAEPDSSAPARLHPRLDPDFAAGLDEETLAMVVEELEEEDRQAEATARLLAAEGRGAAGADEAGRGRSLIFGARVAPGSRLGVAVDMDAGRIYFGFNGNWRLGARRMGNPMADVVGDEKDDEPVMNAAFEFDPASVPDGLVPAVTTARGVEVRVELGENEPMFPPPTGDFRAVHEFLRDAQE